jgi:hypothetical protein
LVSALIVPRLHARRAHGQVIETAAAISANGVARHDLDGRRHKRDFHGAVGASVAIGAQMDGVVLVGRWVVDCRVGIDDVEIEERFAGGRDGRRDRCRWAYRGSSDSPSTLTPRPWD